MRPAGWPPPGLDRKVVDSSIRGKVVAEDLRPRFNSISRIYYIMKMAAHLMFALIVLSCVAMATSNGIHQPQPYKFGYSIKDHHGEQHREESGNGAGSVVGNYGFTDDRGIARQVNYVADHGGFRAQVKTNEPGTANQSPAAVRMISNDPYSRGAVRPYNSRPNEPLELSADAVLSSWIMVMGGYGYGNNGYGYGLNGYGYGSGSYGLGYGRYGNLGYGYGRNLGYNGGYGGVVNFGAPLVGGAIRGYDSRFVTQA
ncbi:cuticle protein 16.8 [Caerostris extrusa]|uniref:Cuticle protein 16.8 n=1 Tax=Caerostris extrusa TaxID=172846 RepID=A0AAV4W157_CAEEX|nr:cuticle protein 16.8 [Caerostris extrusa]